MDTILLPFRRYFEFSGRSRRLEFGVFVLFNIAMSIVLRAVDIQMGTFSVMSQVGFLGGLYGLFILIPGIALGVRRLHDMNASGWWYLLTLDSRSRTSSCSWCCCSSLAARGRTTSAQARRSRGTRRNRAATAHLCRSDMGGKKFRGVLPLLLFTLSPSKGALHRGTFALRRAHGES